MSRPTRVHTIRRHLVQGGLNDLGLTEAEQTSDRPLTEHDDGFSVRQTVDETGTLVVIAAAYGPDWFANLREVRHRLEQPYVKCHVDGNAAGLADNEVRVRWATSDELQARKTAAAKRQAPVRELLRRQQAEERAAEERAELEAAGQSGLF
ncbi:hypothetical protein EV284_6383 [Streptomyces sp. BK022]|uniref:hypothetical protein n=1 Tax=Streptomyces sp. BK022 TaxID=2512123 RepID=UPI00102A3AC6|nr:hypothetical protein [Streptomyces sp. BK022]RZU28217.1 hypothetical protein EV284_6383 [Streptomyces sp. BK022]